MLAMLEIDSAILAALRDVPEIVALAIFGSRARGSSRPDSDLDVAVLFVDGVRESGWRLQGRVAACLSGLAPGGRVDVVVLDEVPELLRQRIFETGRVLLLKDERRWQELRVQTMREHGDREPYRRMLREAQARRLAGSATGHG